MSADGFDAEPEVDLRRSTSPWHRHIRRFVDWFCGLEPASVSATTTPHQRSDVTSLRQTHSARAALYAALSVLITLDLFLYVFFSTGSDFGLLRNSAPLSRPFNLTTLT